MKVENVRIELPLAVSSELSGDSGHAAAAAAAAAVMIAPGTTAAVSTTVVGVTSGRCLDVVGNSTAPKTR